MHNMKFVYTHWSAPSKSDDTDGRFFNRNKIRYKYFYEMFLLSAVSVKKYFPNSTIIFNTDQDGIDFIKNTNIPVDECYNIFEGINFKNTNMWPLAKIYSMSLMKEPFVHLDYDVFFVNNPKIDFNKYDLIIQSLEIYNKLTHIGKYYNSLFENISNKEFDILLEYPSYTAFNAGFIYFNKIDFIKEWYNTVIEIYNKIYDEFDFGEAMLCEQHMLSYFSRKYELNVGQVVGLDTWYKNDFYVHILSDCKYNPNVIIDIIKYLEKNYPEYYKNTHDFDIIKEEQKHYSNLALYIGHGLLKIGELENA